MKILKNMYIYSKEPTYTWHTEILINMIDISMAKHCTLLGIKGYLLQRIAKIRL